MSTLKTNNVQVGQSVTATNNFTLYQPATPDGTVRLGVGNSGATTADVVTATSAGNVGIGTSSPGAKLEVAGQADFTTVVAAGNGIRVRTPSGSGSPAIIQFTDNPVTAQWGYITSPASGVLAFGNATEYARLNSSGNLLVGGTTLQGATGYVGSRTNARVWADFNETTINASHNVSSITVNSSGVYTVNFANALNSSFYAPLVNNRKANDLNDVVGWVNRINNSYTQSTTAFQFASMYSSGSYSPARQYMVIFCN
jgi:hypothetical protein